MASVAFDVDGTLINCDGTPNDDVVLLLQFFVKNGDKVYVWSGGGVDYAKRRMTELDIIQLVKIVDKGSFVPDIAIDDMKVNLGAVNICVGLTI